MRETSKCFKQRELIGLYHHVFVGKGLDVGGGSDTLRPLSGQCVRWDVEDGDGMVLEGVPSNSLNYIYSSHCLEHLSHPVTAVCNWVDKVIPGGYVFVAVPDWTLYEKGVWPSTKNTKHLWAFTLGPSIRAAHIWTISGLLDKVMKQVDVDVLGYWLNDQNYDYSVGPEVDQTLGQASCQIEFLLRKSGGFELDPVLLEQAGCKKFSKDV